MATMTSQNLSSLISSIYVSRKNVLELMKMQGYKTDEYDNFTVNEVNTMHQNKQLDMILEKEEDPITHRKNKIYIRYYLFKVIRPNNVEEMIDDLFNLEEVLTKDDMLFIIVKDEVNDTLINTMKHIWEKDGIFISMVNIKRLLFNILKHSLVPKHRVMNNIEVKTIMERYNLQSLSQFPEISRFDPVAQVIGLRPGQVCEISRPSKTAVISNYYRVCV
jgi:DNA-directed RNA polymerase subunit H (RpoH/RPB5)